MPVSVISGASIALVVAAIAVMLVACGGQGSGPMGLGGGKGFEGTWQNMSIEEATQEGTTWLAYTIAEQGDGFLVTGSQAVFPVDPTGLAPTAIWQAPAHKEGDALVVDWDAKRLNPDLGEDGGWTADGLRFEIDEKHDDVMTMFELKNSSGEYGSSPYEWDTFLWRMADGSSVPEVVATPSAWD